MELFVLDACALIAFLRKEEGSDNIIKILDRAINSEVKLIMHSASLSEVYYDFWKMSDKATADGVLSDMTALPIELEDTISTEMIQGIGYFKANYKISFADSFVLTLFFNYISYFDDLVGV